MKSKAGRIASSLARWIIAVLGVAWVVSNLHWRDRVLLIDETSNLPAERILTTPAAEDAAAFRIDGIAEPVARQRVINGPDRKTVVLQSGKTVKLLGMRLAGDINQRPTVDDLLVETEPGHAAFIEPAAVQGGFKLDVPQPRVMTGIGTMLRKADSEKLLFALGVAPIPFFVTTIRWQKLLAVLGITLTFTRAFVLNMVGAFYNTFMPGSTGGDVLKAYYAAKHAPDHRTGAVMSVIVDRILGLIALVILGGTMAGFHWLTAEDAHDPVTRACRRVAIGAMAIVVVSLLGLAMLYTPAVRRLFTRSDRFVKSRAYQQLRKVMHVMHAYRSRPVLIVAAIVFTMPVHLTTVVSAMLAGQAFGLPLSAGYYFVIVPVIVLAGALPVSPQGVGVMEAFAYYFTRPQGATLNQALALTLSIRLVAVFWNLVGGLFVLRGGYHAPTQAEQQELADAPVASI
ncbi:MAG: lysylphosphatidylglycerol synthase transmembrane domain-containing protein [Tepidisphaeraceae bacterium]